MQRKQIEQRSKLLDKMSLFGKSRRHAEKSKNQGGGILHKKNKIAI